MAALVSASTAQGVPAFMTPEKTIYCGVVEAYKSPPFFVPPLTCWRPRNGFTVFLRALHGTETEWNPRNKDANPYTIRMLGFGRWWWATRSYQGFGPRPRERVAYRCLSRTTGLTCTNRVGHGFWLGSPSGVYLF